MPYDFDNFYKSCLKLWKEPFGFEDFFQIAIDSIGRESKKFSVHEAVFKLMGRYDFITFIDTKEIYVKDHIKGCYIRFGQEIIEMELSRYEEDYRFTISHYNRRKIVQEIQLRTLFERSEIAEHKFPYWLNFRNVWYNVETKQTFKHNYTLKDYVDIDASGDMTTGKELYELHKQFEEETIFLTSIDIKFDVSSKCPNFDTFLERILPDKRSRDTVFEIFGYCLYNGYPIQKAILCIGDGDNGKSTLLLVLKKFLGEHNVTAVDLYSLAEDRFASAELYMKKACINADLESKYLSNTGVLKRLTGGDLIMGQRKRKDPFYFRNIAKIILSMNQLFKVSDSELIHSFFRRLCILQFPVRIPKPEKRDQDKLVAEMTTDCELSGILIKALEGLDRLLKNKAFSNKMDEDRLREEWMRLSDPAKWFFEQVVSEGNDEEPGEDYWQSDLFEIFLKICKKENLPEQSEQYFSRMASKYNIKKKRKQKKFEGRKTMYLNLCFNNGYSGLALKVLQEKDQKKKEKGTKTKENKFERFVGQLSTGKLKKFRQVLSYCCNDEGEISFRDIKAIAFSKNFSRSEINDLILNLQKEGEIYEPRPGVFRFMDE